MRSADLLPLRQVENASHVATRAHVRHRDEHDEPARCPNSWMDSWMRACRGHLMRRRTALNRTLRWALRGSNPRPPACKYVQNGSGRTPANRYGRSEAASGHRRTGADVCDRAINARRTSSSPASRPPDNDALRWRAKATHGVPSRPALTTADTSSPAICRLRRAPASPLIDASEERAYAPPGPTPHAVGV